MAQLWHHDRIIPPRIPEETEKHRNQSNQRHCFPVPLMVIKVLLFPLKTYIHTPSVTGCTALEMTVTKERPRNVHTPSYLSIFGQTHTADKDTQVVQTRQVRKSIFKSITELEKNTTKNRSIKNSNFNKPTQGEILLLFFALIFYSFGSNVHGAITEQRVDICTANSALDGARPREPGHFLTHLDQNLAMWGSGVWGLDSQ